MNDAFRMLFDEVKSGVVWAQRDGVVRYANKAAVQLTPCLLGQPLLDPVAARALQDVGSNLLQMPYRFEMRSPEGLADVVRAVVLPAPVGKDLMLVLENASEVTWYRQALKNLVAYMEVEMVEPLGRLGDAVRAIKADPKAALETAGVQTLAEQAQALSKKMHAMETLVQAFGSDDMVRDERILMADLLQETLGACAPLLTQRHVTVKGNGLKQDLAVYGSATWLRRALMEFLAQAVLAAPRGATIELTLEGLGTRVRVRAVNKGIFLSGLDRRRAETPFGAGDKAGQGTPRIGLALARAVVERHGGVVRIDDTHDSVDFVLEMPAGAPAEQAPQLAVEQAQRYALDMARLLARQSPQRGKNTA